MWLWSGGQRACVVHKSISRGARRAVRAVLALAAIFSLSRSTNKAIFIMRSDRPSACREPATIRVALHASTRWIAPTPGLRCWHMVPARGAARPLATGWIWSTRTVRYRTGFLLLSGDKSQISSDSKRPSQRRCRTAVSSCSPVMATASTFCYRSNARAPRWRSGDPCRSRPCDCDRNRNPPSCRSVLTHGQNHRRT
jgi:hypothetical protein